MKKLFSFCIVALMSASVLADRSTVPNPSNLSSFDPSANVVLCVYFDEQVCNDVILMGDYNDWNENSEATVKMRPLEGFDGWYVAAVAPDAAGADKKFKPVQLKTDGSFSWDFQCGPKDAWVKANAAGADLDIQEELGGAECGLHYKTAGAYIYYCTYWKAHNVPCSETKDYTIKVYIPECEYVEDVTIGGGFDNWVDINHSMDFDVDQDGRVYYYFTMKDQLPGIAYKIKAGEGWGNQVEELNEKGEWAVINGGGDFHLGTDAEIIHDWSDPAKYRWQTCQPAGEEVEFTVTVKLPEFCDEIASYANQVKVIGEFDNWAGTDMTLVEAGVYSATIIAKRGTAYKYRAGNSWDVEVMQSEGSGMADLHFPAEGTTVNDDWSMYFWKGCPAPTPHYKDYNAWQIKTAATNWEFVEMTKVSDGVFAVDIESWISNGFNVTADTNPIKQGWYPADDPALTIAEGVAEGDKVTVTLTVVDDETLTLNVAKSSITGMEAIEAALDADGTYIINGQMYIKQGNKVINVLGF
ncbi:MAG: hypothetical protein MJZ64_03550 [Paludibacteraceae bacterium]|nr:hypothetical protein [Paludibacteraceae bacterium]